jgi:hypothetical protein
MASRITDLEQFMGRKYGVFTVIEVFFGTIRNKGGVICRCRCVCGEERDYFAADAKRKRSCGCVNNKRFGALTKGKPAYNRKTYGESASNGLYCSYINRARKGFIEFNLTKEQFFKLTQENCYFCGVIPSNSYPTSKTQYGPYKHNGIDRINNSLGYILENCVACCKWCNFAKNIRSEEDYLKWIKRSYEHLQAKNLL